MTASPEEMMERHEQEAKHAQSVGRRSIDRPSKQASLSTPLPTNIKSLKVEEPHTRKRKSPESLSISPLAKRIRIYDDYKFGLPTPPTEPHTVRSKKRQTVHEETDAPNKRRCTSGNGPQSLPKHENVQAKIITFSPLSSDIRRLISSMSAYATSEPTAGPPSRNNRNAKPISSMRTQDSSRTPTYASVMDEPDLLRQAITDHGREIRTSMAPSPSRIGRDRLGSRNSSQKFFRRATNVARLALQHPHYDWPIHRGKPEVRSSITEFPIQNITAPVAPAHHGQDPPAASLQNKQTTWSTMKEVRIPEIQAPRSAPQQPCPISTLRRGKPASRSLTRQQSAPNKPATVSLQNHQPLLRRSKRLQEKAQHRAPY